MKKLEIKIFVIFLMRKIKNFILDKLPFIFKIYVNYRKKNEKIKNKIDQVENEYRELIDEFKLIEEKKSMLSANERRIVKARILHLIGRGHIKLK